MTRPPLIPLHTSLQKPVPTPNPVERCHHVPLKLTKAEKAAIAAAADARGLSIAAYARSVLLERSGP